MKLYFKKDENVHRFAVRGELLEKERERPVTYHDSSPVMTGHLHDWSPVMTGHLHDWSPVMTSYLS